MSGLWFNNILHSAGDIFFVGGILGCCYLLIASALTFCFRSTQRRQLSTPPPVTVLVPLCGAEPELSRRLLMLCSQDYSAPVQIICGVRDITDPAIDVVRQIDTIHPLHSIEYHVDVRVYGANPKISNLINMVRLARYETLIMIDSDIEVEPGHLSSMVAELHRPKIGAVTCLYQGAPAGGFWAQLAALRINSDFLPGVIVASTFALARPCFGASIAISSETLKRLGGFEAFANHLWDDYAIGEAVRELGYEVAIAPVAVGHVCAQKTMGEWLADEIRAARTVRKIEPIGYAGSIIAYPLPLALIASISYGKLAITLAFIALVSRMILSLSVEHRFNARSDNMLFLALREFLSFVIYLSGFAGASVKWRGQQLRFSRRAASASSRLRA